jgi:RNA polymerase sigma-70 factor (ECF subfamily)
MPIGDQSSRQDKLYEEALALYKNALERLVRAYESNSDKQGDLLQDVHLALWQSFQNYEERCSLRTWVYRVAHNTAASHVVREQRTSLRKWVGLEAVDAVTIGTASEVPERKLDLDRLLELIHQLNPFARQLMLLYLEGMDAESIGDVTGLSAGNVRVQMHRIRTILSRQFHGDGK